eukprot:CAMPEP_0185011692 /NCGR_PEP_ID=MMETSP1098-20130426/97920_1 /TAXON_ID=89044 /ORGANISM="Spumella elongata, Strain CCAP 955/1" /LENGTH=495 /DNA_ID=CAMNT_0027540733 /DNA_START=470 /DNA_END=1957 /DNA_ORIENTATION=-
MADFEETQTADYWKTKGNEFYMAKSYQPAIAAYTKAINLDSTNAALLTNRAAASLMLLLYNEAIQDCNAALALDSSNSKAYFRKATALKGLGKLPEAIAALNKGLEFDPLSKTALADKSALLSAQEKIAEIKNLLVMKQFQMALRQIENVTKEVGGNFRDFNILKVEALLELSRPEEAYNLSNLMMRTAQNGDVDLLRLRAQCFYSLGDLENALKHMQQAVRSDPDNTQVRAYYRQIKEIDEKKSTGDEAFKSGDHAGAIEAWSLCLNLTKNNRPFSSKLHLNRATAYLKLKNYDAAVKDCNMAIYYNEKYLKAYLRRAESYVLSNVPENIQLGIEDYEKAYELETDEDALKDIKLKVKKAKVQLKRSKRKDLYSILGVSQTATEGEIKTAYRKSALKLHPDKQANKTDEEKATAEAQFKAVNEAYEVLSCSEKKQKYDEGVELEDLDNPHAGHGHDHGHHHHHHGGGGGGGGMGGIDPNILFQMFMQQQQQGRR